MLLTETSLEQVVAALGSPQDVLAQETNLFEATAQGRGKLVIFGCGHLGGVVLAGAIRAGLDVLAFADNNREAWGQAVEGVPIISPEEAVSRYNDVTFFVVAIYNGTTPREQLCGLGCKRIVPYLMFFWQFSRFMPEEDRLELPHRIIEHVVAMRLAYGLLGDNVSRAEFVSQIRWRCSLDYACLSRAEPPEDMYYAPDLVRLTPDEVLVDCGAFDGDSIRMFLNKTRNSFRHIYAVEPDPKNLAVLERYLAALPENLNSNVSVLSFGVSERNETVSFNVTGTVGSRISEAPGSASIECRKLDDLLSGPEPTLIKMDIEGAEPRAIEGAMDTIRRARPILAVCAYHKCEHLWTLPVLIKAALPEYHVFLRRYAEECWETVYYAIPPERLTDAWV